jgi:TonB family protein
LARFASLVQAGIGIALVVAGDCGQPGRETVRLTTLNKCLVAAVLGSATVSVIANPLPTQAQEQEVVKTDDLARKPRARVAPIYPEMARRLNIEGTVKLAVVVAPNGTVKSSKAVGGHPLLVNAAITAMKQWKFETAPTESSGIVEFKFQPQR